MSTHVRDPLADGSEDLRCGANPDIVLTPTGALTVAIGADDEAVEAILEPRSSQAIVVVSLGELRSALQKCVYNFLLPFLRTLSSK